MSHGRVVHEARLERAARLARLTSVGVHQVRPAEACPGGEPSEKWAGFVRNLRSAVPTPIFHIWFEDIHPHRVEGDVVVVGANPDKAPGLNDRFRSVLALAADRPVRAVGCERLRGPTTGGKG